MTYPTDRPRMERINYCNDMLLQWVKQLNAELNRTCYGCQHHDNGNCALAPVGQQAIPAHVINEACPQFTQKVPF